MKLGLEGASSYEKLIDFDRGKIQEGENFIRKVFKTKEKSEFQVEKMEMVDFVKWIFLIQVISLAVEAKPVWDCDVTFEDCGKSLNFLHFQFKIEHFIDIGILILPSGSLYDVVRLNIGTCSGAPCFMPFRGRVKIIAEFEFMGKFIAKLMRLIQQSRNQRLDDKRTPKVS